MGYEIHSMDVNNAFLQALLKEDIYISQAEGFESKEHPDYVCRLICALYGLKQAPLAWNCTLNQYLLDLGFKSTPAHPCVYCYHESSKRSKAYKNEMHSTFCLNTTNCTVILSVYIDDLILIGHLNDIKLLKKRLHEHFKLKDLGHITRILGITVHYDSNAGTLDLLQPDKIAELSDEFGLTDCKLLSSPLPAGCNLDIIKTTPPSSVKLPYHRIIGALLWIALASHPDILFATIYLTHFLCGYDHTHLRAQFGFPGLAGGRIWVCVANKKCQVC